jgi:hypothetical protein
MHIFDIATMKCLQTLDTAPNTNGVMAFSADEVCLLAKYCILEFAGFMVNKCSFGSQGC